MKESTDPIYNHTTTVVHIDDNQLSALLKALATPTTPTTATPESVVRLLRAFKALNR